MKPLTLSMYDLDDDDRYLGDIIFKRNEEGIEIDRPWDDTFMGFDPGEARRIRDWLIDAFPLDG